MYYIQDGALSFNYHRLGNNIVNLGLEIEDISYLSENSIKFCYIVHQGLRSLNDRLEFSKFFIKKFLELRDSDITLYEKDLIEEFYNQSK